MLGIRLVSALGVHIEIDAGVRIVDRLDADALPLVFVVVLVLVISPQTERAKATASRFLKCVVVSLIGCAVLFVCPVKPVAHIG